MPALWFLALVVPSPALAAKSLAVHFHFPGQQHHLLGLTELLCHRVAEASLNSARVLREISRMAGRCLVAHFGTIEPRDL